jgi:hypothetical protein
MNCPLEFLDHFGGKTDQYYAICTLPGGIDSVYIPIYM